MAEDFEQFRSYLPSYLTATKASELFAQLREFPRNLNYYTADSSLSEEILQGDGWMGFQVRNFWSGESKQVHGVVISNSCDVSADNSRALPPRILFAPIVPFASYEEVLRRVLAEGASSKIDATKKQLITNVFYLPPTLGGGEGVIFLDDVHSQPLSAFSENPERRSIFTLNQYGFYIFLLKLSIHLTRMGEGVSR